MKNQTLDDLGKFLDDDISWRKKDLITIRRHLEECKDKKLDCFLRGAIVLLYAHWEGFIKNAGSRYVEYVAVRRLRYRELNPGLLALAIKKRLNQIGNNVEDIKSFCTMLQEGLENKSRNFESIDTKSNLSSKVLKDIMCALDLDYEYYRTKEILIDEKLLGNRNMAAHGDFMIFDFAEYLELHKQVLDMMEHFKTEVGNAAANKLYIREECR